jgi:hypothetical protein
VKKKLAEAERSAVPRHKSAGFTRKSRHENKAEAATTHSVPTMSTKKTEPATERKTADEINIKISIAWIILPPFEFFSFFAVLFISI